MTLKRCSWIWTSFTLTALILHFIPCIRFDALLFCGVQQLGQSSAYVTLTLIKLELFIIPSIDSQHTFRSQALRFAWSNVTKIAITEKLPKPLSYDVDKIFTSKWQCRFICHDNFLFFPQIWGLLWLIERYQDDALNHCGGWIKLRVYELTSPDIISATLFNTQKVSQGWHLYYYFFHSIQTLASNKSGQGNKMDIRLIVPRPACVIKSYLHKLLKFFKLFINGGRKLQERIRAFRRPHVIYQEEL